jgi:hypothetical protein
MCASVVALGVYCRSLLGAAVAGEQVGIGTFGFWACVGGFLLASAAVVVVQSMRLAHRVAGPELRLRRALHRIRCGDVGFRITLRRGDLLGGIARECNELIDWLNRNPPPGVRTGSDIVEVPVESGPRKQP